MVNFLNYGGVHTVFHLADAAAGLTRSLNFATGYHKFCSCSPPVLDTVADETFLPVLSLESTQTLLNFNPAATEPTKKVLIIFIM